MLRKNVFVFAVLIFFVMTSAAWAQLKDGLWEMTSRTEIKGMPQQMPSTTFRQCLTKSDPVPQSQDKSFDCKTTSRKISGDTVTYVVECRGKDGVMVTKGKNTYTGLSMEGSSETSFKMQGQPEMQMTTKMKGTYIGACPK
ncbi:MAG: DUF3617 family protein [Smithellaceae bacterium]